MAFRYDTFNTFVYDRVPDRARVLDVGCSTGRLCEALETRKSCVCSGLERDPAAVQEARKRCSEGVDHVDLDDSSAVARVLAQRSNFDVVVCSDVLEHLREPTRVLGHLASAVRPGGYVICSLPNIAFWRKRLMLLRGRWDYEEVGICDRTHLRFYTEQSARKLVVDAGLAVRELAYAGIGGRYEQVKKLLPRMFAAGFIIVAERRS